MHDACITHCEPHTKRYAHTNEHALIVLAVSVVLAMTIRGTLGAKRRDEDSIGFVLWVAATGLFTPIVWPHRTLGPVLRATATEPSLCYVCLRSKMPRDLPAQM